MNPVSAAVIFFVTWWLVLFMVLPWGVRRTESPEIGHDHGAPARSMMWRKLAATTVIALIIFSGLYAAAEYEILTIEDLMLHL